MRLTSAGLLVCSLLLVGGCPINRDNSAANKAVVEGLLADLSGTHDHTTTHHTDATIHNPVGHIELAANEDNSAAIAVAFPDMSADIVSIEASGNWVLVDYELSGTFTGDLMVNGVLFPPTGNSFAVDVHVAYIFNAAGMIIHDVLSLDTGDQAAQLFAP